jgi:hypothetical protein
MSLTRTTTGLVLAETFADVSDWTLVGADLRDLPAYCIGARSPITALAPTASSPDAGGVREGQISVIADGTWVFSYGAGDGTVGAGGPWRVQFASSTTRGRTAWTKDGPTDFGLDKTSTPADGAWAARDNLFMWEASDGELFLFPMSAETVSASVVPGQSYETDLFSADDFTGPWTFIRRALVKNPSGGQIDSDSATGGCVVESGGTFYLFYSPISDTNAFQISYATSSTIDGAYTKLGTAIIPSAIAGTPENPKVWWSATLNCWVMSTNQITEGVGTLNSRFFYSTSLTDWTDAQHSDPMRVSPDHHGENAVGIISPFYVAEGIPVEDADGRLPITYDAGGTGSAFHLDRSLYYAVLEPSRYCLPLAPPFLFRDNFNRSDRDIDGDNGWDEAVGSDAVIATGKLDLGSSAGDRTVIQTGVSEADPLLKCDFAIANNTSIGFVFRYTDTTHFYLLDVSWNGSSNLAELYYRNGGAFTSVDGSHAIGSSGTTFNAEARVRGTSIQLYVNGVLGQSWTDSTLSAAGNVGLRNGQAGTGQRLADNFEAYDNTATTHSATRTITNGNAIHEFFARLRPGSPEVNYDYRLTSGTGYRVKLDLTGLTLIELASGTPSTLATNSGDIVPTVNDLMNVRLVVSGSSHKGYLNGELQYDVTDNTTASGSTVAFSGVDSEVRLLSMYADEAVTVTGLSNGQVVTLRGAGGIPIDTATVSGTSHVFDDLTHYPANFVEVDGEDHTLGADEIWGGDTLNVSGGAGRRRRLLTCAA